MTLHANDIDWGNGHSFDAQAESDPEPPAVVQRARRKRPLAALLTLLITIENYVRRYVVLTDHQAIAITLWTAHTHAIDAADCTPYLHVGSATKRAGKTRLLEVLEPVVARPWFTGRTSAAALVRKVDADAPTLLLDESDAAFKGEREYAEALRGTLNSGYRRSGKATVCIGQGANITARDFLTFCPKVIAGIGTLPDTVADRSIAIQLRRRTRDEPCDRWRERDGHAQAAPIHKALASWARRAVLVLRDARPALPSGLGDRQTDVWEPLIAIADATGGDWPARARRAALALAGAVEDADITIQLLRDAAEILPAVPDSDMPDSVIPTKELLTALVAREDRPWATWRHNKPITPHSLARLLAPLGIRAVHLEHVRGYRRDALKDAIARYLPVDAPDPSSEASVRQRANDSAPDLAFSNRQCKDAAGGSKNANPRMIPGQADALTLRSRALRAAEGAEGEDSAPEWADEADDAYYGA